MTTHTLRITIDTGEMTYGRAAIICSDNGGPDCAEPVNGDDCPDAIYAEECAGSEDHSTAEEAWDDVGECDGWWWEGDHYHPGSVGIGCKYTLFAESCGDDALDLVTKLTIEVPVSLGHLDWEEPLRVTPTDTKATP